ncbi:MAG: tRNA glutamyl-Q(34) synthetase GluQRS [bacterium]
MPLHAANDQSSSPVIGRLAPSPTGGLHIGNARTFLFAWLLARHSGGRLIFRTEDLDATRARAEAAADAIEDLRWLGLTWDEGPDVGGPAGPYVQSERGMIYRKYLEVLIQKDLVYPCTCTRADVARAASAPHAGELTRTYPGPCSRLRAETGLRFEAESRAFAWRFRTAGKVVSWHDMVRGDQRHDLATAGGDFIVARSASVYSYQLAAVVDDGLMRVNQVVRGHDLVESTPRQILLQEALGLPRPEYWHLGLVMDGSGKRLAKRDQSIRIRSLRESGIRPDQLREQLMKGLGWAPDRWDACGYTAFREAIGDWKKEGLNLANDWTWA